MWPVGSLHYEALEQMLQLLRRTARELTKFFLIRELINIVRIASL